MFTVLRDPWEATGLALGVLEKIGESAKGATRGIFGDCDTSEDEDDLPKLETPELIRETEEALSKLLKTLAKIFAEPFKTKDDEINEVVGKMNKGAIEFVLKPVVGMPYLASLTTRGISNDPKTIYLNTDKFIMKKTAETVSPYQFSIKKQNITVHMDKGFNVVVDERALKREIIEAFRKRGENINELAFESSTLHKPAIKKSTTKIESKVMIGPSREHNDLLIDLSEKSQPAADCNTKLPITFDDSIDREFYHVDEFSNDGSICSEELNENSDFMTVEELETESPRSTINNIGTIEEEHITQRPIATTNYFKKNSIIEEQKIHPILIEEEKNPIVVMKAKPERNKLLTTRAQEIIEKAKAHGFSKYNDDYRVPPADKVGGLPLIDKKVTETLRNVAKEYLKQFFSRILRGNFNLTTISFPIKCMRPISILETFGLACVFNPIYLNKAALLTDPIEQCKYMLTSQISTYHLTSSFLKPVLFNSQIA